MRELQPATIKLGRSFIRHAIGMLKACEEWLNAQNVKDKN